jgi:hypothetical protein
MSQVGLDSAAQQFDFLRIYQLTKANGSITFEGSNLLLRELAPI